MADTRRLKALHDYEAENDGELSLKKGDVIFIPNIGHDSEMVQGVSNGKVGFFPRNCVEDTTIEHEVGTATAVKAIHEYEAQAEGELSFPLGAKLFVVSKVNKDFWMGVYQSESGLVPASHVVAAKGTDGGAKGGITKGSTRSAEEARGAILGDLDGIVNKIAPGASIKKKGGRSSASGGFPGLDVTSDGLAPPKTAVASGGFPGLDSVEGLENTKEKKTAFQDWDWGKTPKSRAERELTGLPNGTFLVRASESDSDSFSISVVANESVRHIRILQVPGGFCVNKSDAPSPDIAALIKDKQGQKLTSRPTGSHASMKESKLLKKPLPRSTWAQCPQPLAYLAKAKGKVRAGANKGTTSQSSVDPFATPAAGFPTSPPSFVRNPLEEKVYEGLWKRAPGANTGVVGAGAAAKFFSTSGLDKTKLAHIWNFADISNPKGQLNQAEFFVALKLIALAQSGSRFGIKDIANPAKLPQLQGHTEVVQAGFRAPPPMAPSKKGAWAVPQAEFERFEGFFKGVDKDGDGFVGGGEVMSLMAASKLDKAILGKIWNLADINSTGLLTVEQFALAMWLIAQKVKGVEVPNSLAPDMVPPSMRKPEAKAKAPPVVVAEVAPVTEDPFAVAVAVEAPVVVDPFAVTAPVVVDPFADTASAPVVVDPFAAPAPTPVEVDVVVDAVGYIDLTAAAKKAPAPKPPPSKTAAVAVPPTPTVPDPADYLSLDDVAVYNALWLKAADGAASLQPGAAVGFLQASGLDNSELGVIWEISDVLEPKGSLVQEEFFLSLRMIALTQAGHSVSVANLKLECDLPQLTPHTDDVKAALAPVVAAAVPVLSLLALNDDEKVFYAACWKRVLGILGTPDATTVGPSVVGFMQESSLNNEVLGQIWEIADADAPKGLLSELEFYVALKLIAAKQAGLEASLESLGADTPFPALGVHSAEIAAAASPLEACAKRLWEMAKASQDADGKLDGGTLKPILMKSSLAGQVLGPIWAKADTESKGSLDYDQFKNLLGFIGQAQRSEEISTATFTPTMAAPVLEGL
eukprot:m.111177 g.111177  ORF g.111177 m.111177 type:complete len:1035 (-) comp28102_c0_seq1:66-3170(-)